MSVKAVKVSLTVFRQQLLSMKRVGIIHGGVEIRQEEFVNSKDDGPQFLVDSNSNAVPTPIRPSQTVSGATSIQPPGMRLRIIESF